MVEASLRCEEQRDHHHDAPNRLVPRTDARPAPNSVEQSRESTPVAPNQLGRDERSDGPTLCPECDGEGEVFTINVTAYGYADPQTETSWRCRTCDGTGVAP